MQGTQRDLARARPGEPSEARPASGEVRRRLGPPLRRSVQIIAPALVDEVCAATWARVGRERHRAPADEREVRIWLARIARDEAALRRRSRRRRPDAVFDAIDLATARAAALASGTGPAGAALAPETAVGLVTELSAEVAEMVAWRVVLGLDAQDCGAVLGQRPGSVVVAVHGGLRRASNLLGAAVGRASAGAGPHRGGPGPDPWAVDRLLDRGPGGLAGLDPAMRTLVAALREPSAYAPGRDRPRRPAALARARSPLEPPGQ